MNERFLQNSVYRMLLRRGDKFFAPNFFLCWETDMISVTRDMKVCEFECKISRADFQNDLKKAKKHECYREGRQSHKIPNRFYYVCPTGLIQKHEVPSYAGLLWVSPELNNQGKPRIPLSVKKAPSLHTQPADNALIIRICRSCMYRYWNQRLRKFQNLYR